MSTVRDPAARALSRFYHFRVARRGIDGSDASAATYLRTAPRDVMLRYLWPLSSSDEEAFSASDVDAGAAVERLLAEYTFIGVAERRTDSAVALSLILNVSVADVLVFDAKTRGVRFDNLGIEFVARPEPPGPLVQRAIQSAAYRKRHAGDYTRVAAVNARLDATIAALGGRFDEALRRYEALQAAVRRECDPVWPCNQTSGAAQVRIVSVCMLWLNPQSETLLLTASITHSGWHRSRLLLGRQWLRRAVHRRAGGT